MHVILTVTVIWTKASIASILLNATDKKMLPDKSVLYVIYQDVWNISISCDKEIHSNKKRRNIKGSIPAHFPPST